MITRPKQEFKKLIVAAAGPKPEPVEFDEQSAVEIYRQGIRPTESAQSFVRRIASAVGIPTTEQDQRLTSAQPTDTEIQALIHHRGMTASQTQRYMRRQLIRAALAKWPVRAHAEWTLESIIKLAIQYGYQSEKVWHTDQLRAFARALLDGRTV